MKRIIVIFILIFFSCKTADNTHYTYHYIEPIIIDLEEDELLILDIIFKYNNIIEGIIFVNQYSYPGIEEMIDAYNVFTRKYNIGQELEFDRVIRKSYKERNSLPIIINEETKFSINHIWREKYFKENIDKNLDPYYSLHKMNNYIGTVEFSRAGFNENRTEAIIYFQFNKPEMPEASVP